MTLQQLHYFLEIYRTKSISKAARRLFVAPSSISIALSNLERELGCPLFTRTTQGLIPTRQGSQVLAYANAIQENCSFISNVAEQSRKHVRISASSHTACEDAFLRLIQETQKQDDISFSLESLSIAKALRKLSAFELDCGILFISESDLPALEMQLEEEHLQWKIHASIPAVITLGPGHRLYGKSNVSLKDLQNDMLVDPSPSPFAPDEAPKKHTDLPSHRILAVNNTRCSNLLIAEGLAFSIGQKQSQEITQQYRLRYIPLEGVNFLLISATNPLQQPPEVSRYLELLDEELAKSKNWI